MRVAGPPEFVARDVVLVWTDRVFEAVEAAIIGVNRLPCSCRSIHFFITRELASWSGVGPSEIGHRNRPEGGPSPSGDPPMVSLL